MSKVFVSSTFVDLEACRQAVSVCIRRMGLEDIAMEYFVAEDSRPLTACLDAVGRSDLYVGLFAWRYGFVPEKDNPHNQSITELEYREALAEKKDCLILLLDPSTPWVPSLLDEDLTRIKNLREELANRHSCAFFQTPQEIGGVLAPALHRWAESHLGASRTVTNFESGKLRISTARLPSTDRVVVGREAELQKLDAAWQDPRCHVLSIIAAGGAGKSSLVNRWLIELEGRGWAGAEAVFGWSFYRQGAQVDTQASADLFLANALAWFGDPSPDIGSAWDKGERLADLIRSKQTLLILDGVEPLQSLPRGTLRDEGVEALIRELARLNPGLCLITSRIEIDQLKDLPAELIWLDRLPRESGVQYLQILGARGTGQELSDAVDEAKGHALALTLLGSYVDLVYGGDIRRRKEMGLLESWYEGHGHALRVIQSYERWFQDRPELDILRLLSVFDRPATAAALDALRAGPAIVGLTDMLSNLSSQDWRIALRNLRKTRLLDPVDANAPDDLDCHPLIRAFFADEMRKSLPETWRLAHRRLYEHYKETTEELPATISQIARLYSAVAHGCQAGLFESAFQDVYWPRIQQGPDFASSRRLGTLGADLEALGHFFSHRWTQTVRELLPVTRARIITQAGFDLRGCGRLEQADAALQEALRAYEELEDWPSAASVASNLSVMYLHLGKLAHAVQMAERGVSFADQSGQPHRRAWERTTLADSLHQCGKLAEARKLFEEVEAIEDAVSLHANESIQGKDGFGVGADAIINRHHGFRHCDFLLSLGMVDKVLQKGMAQIREGKTSGVLLLQGFGHLSVGKARLAQSRVDSETAMHLNEAVNIVRRASQQHHTPRPLIARSEFFRKQMDFSRSEHDLEEADFLAKRAGMMLHECDCHLSRARLYRASNRYSLAREHYDAARRMVLAMGYHRRDKELAEIEIEIRGAGAG